MLLHSIPGLTFIFASPYGSNWPRDFSKLTISQMWVVRNLVSKSWHFTPDLHFFSSTDNSRMVVVPKEALTFSTSWFL